MIWLLATLLLALSAPFVLWPLITHWQPEPERDQVPAREEARRRELEEIELDLAAGRLTADEAALRRRELS